MKKIHLLYITFALLLTGLTSCEDLLTEEPNSKYDRDRYFDSEEKAEMAVMGIYSSADAVNSQVGTVDSLIFQFPQTFNPCIRGVELIVRDVVNLIVGLCTGGIVGIIRCRSSHFIPTVMIEIRQGTVYPHDSHFRFFFRIEVAVAVIF